MISLKIRGSKQYELLMCFIGICMEPVARKNFEQQHGVTVTGVSSSLMFHFECSVKPTLQYEKNLNRKVESFCDKCPSLGACISHIFLLTFVPFYFATLSIMTKYICSKNIFMTVSPSQSSLYFTNLFTMRKCRNEFFVLSFETVLVLLQRFYLVVQLNHSNFFCA